jgi:hypothetical protein
LIKSISLYFAAAGLLLRHLRRLQQHLRQHQRSARPTAPRCSTAVPAAAVRPATAAAVRAAATAVLPTASPAAVPAAGPNLQPGGGPAVPAAARPAADCETAGCTAPLLTAGHR